MTHFWFPDLNFGFRSDWSGSDDYGKLKLEYSPDKDSDISISVYRRDFYGRRDDNFTGVAIPPRMWEDREASTGSILKGGWRHSENGVVSLGAEASDNTTDMNTYSRKYSEDKRAIYLNETYTIGSLTMNAGVRYDNDYVYGSETSPSAGLVYDFKDASTLLRLNVARGFSPPPIIFRYSNDPQTVENPDLKAERAWTYQAGIETKGIPGIWTKMTFYRADVADALDAVKVGTDPNTGMDVNQMQNFRRFSRQGVEVEAKTNEYKGLSLSYGYAFNEVKNEDTKEIIKNKPRVTHDIGLDYRGPFETRTIVKGKYIWWNAEEGSPFNGNAQDQNFLWDAKVGKYLVKWKKAMGEVFVSVHNITDVKQYQMEAYPNPGRWVEAGVFLTSF